MLSLADSYGDLGREAEALELLEETLALMKAKLGVDHILTLRCMNNLALTYYVLGRHGDALQLHEKTLALQKAKLGPDHIDTLQSMHNLANSYQAVDRYADALELREVTLALRKAKLGPEHLDTLKNMNNLAHSYAAFGRHPEALALRQETLALQKAKFGPDHPDTLMSMFRVAACLVELDRSADAVPIIDECLRRAAGKLVHPQLIPEMMNLRLRQFEKIGDAVGCLETADKWEGLKRSDAESLYNSACFRSVCAAVIQETDKTPTGEMKAKEQADQAMTWLKQAVAAGFKDAAHIKQDQDLEALRDREDFGKLLTELDGGPP